MKNKVIPGKVTRGERSYAYAKACGIIGKSFVGKRIDKLENIARLSELDRVIFPDSYRELPEKELLTDLEDRIINRAVDSIISIVECFAHPPEFLILLLRSYEYADIKSIIYLLHNNNSEAENRYANEVPPHTYIGPYQTIKFKAWPDFPAMVKNTEFEFLLEMDGILQGNQEDLAMQSYLDRQYYKALWKSLAALPVKDRQITQKILSYEISLKDSCLALRLRTYYKMKSDEIKPYLIYLSNMGNSHSLAEEAISCLEIPLDDHSAWSDWRWRNFLNPDSGPRQWKADPRYFQNAASRFLYRTAKKYFHLRPFSLDSIFCFIKLKQFEEDLLTSSVEGLNISMTNKEVFSMLGVVH